MPKINWTLIIKVYLLSFTLVFFAVLLVYLYSVGFQRGQAVGKHDAEEEFYDRLALINKEAAQQMMQYQLAMQSPEPTPVVTINPSSTPSDDDQQSKYTRSVEWGGPELWEEVNNKRITYGVGVLNQADELCTIASIRLNEQLVLGQLDNHEGFGNLEERRPDLAWIFEKYGQVAEFLLAGADTPQEAVSLWENTLGHKKLLTGGEFVYGCIYAQDGFAVAITAF